MGMPLVRIMLGVHRRLVQDAHGQVIVLVRRKRRRMLEDGWGLPHGHMSFLVIIILEMRS
jgi:hypothetical protein